MKVDKVYKIYKLTAPDGRCYIGQTSRPKPNYRWVGGKAYKQCPAIQEAIEAYGWDSFTHEIIDECYDEETATKKEQYWIAYYRATENEYGFNLTSGGKFGYTHSPSSKEKTSRSHKGIRPSDETRQKLRELALARPPMSDEHKRKISEANTGHWVSPEGRERRRISSTGRTHSEATKEKIRNNPNCNGNRVKKVRCIETGEVFPSAREASYHLGKNKGAVTNAIFTGTACCGFHFEYLTKGVEEVMPISDDKTRVQIILPKTLKEKLLEIADKENRSLSNLIITILQEYISKR